MPRGFRVWRDLIRGRTPGQPIDMDTRLTTHQRRNNEGLRSRAIAPLGPPQHLSHIAGPKGDKGDTGDTGPAGPQGPEGPAGASEFDLLTDTFTYPGHAGKIVAVKETEDGLEPISGGALQTADMAADILDGASLLPDGSFEWDTLAPGLPDYWVVVGSACSVRLTADDSHAGRQCIEFYDRTVVDELVRIVADPRNVPDHPGYFPIDSGCVYMLAGWAKRVNAVDDGNRLVFHLGCYDADFVELVGTVDLDIDPPPTDWTYYTKRVGPGEATTWPADTAYVRFSIRDISGGTNAVNRADAVRLVLTSGEQTTHNILSAEHPDTTVAVPADGDIIIRSGGKWIRLPKGSDGEFLKLIAGLPGWAAGAIAAHVLATTTGLGAYHTVSDLTARQILRAISGSDAAFQTPDFRHNELAAGTLGRPCYRGDSMLTNGIFWSDQDADGIPDSFTGASGPGAIGRVETDSIAGGACLEFKSRTEADTPILIYAGSNTNGQLIPVNGGASYTIGMTCRRSGSLNGNRMQLIVMCYGTAGLSDHLSDLTVVDANPPPATWGSYAFVVGASGFGEQFTWPSGTKWVRLKIQDISSNTAAENLVASVAMVPSVYGHNCAARLAGSGLQFTTLLGLRDQLAVVVDDSTIEINANTVRLKDGGVTAAKLVDQSRTWPVLLTQFRNAGADLGVIPSPIDESKVWFGAFGSYWIEWGNTCQQPIWASGIPLPAELVDGKGFTLAVWAALVTAGNTDYVTAQVYNNTDAATLLAATDTPALTTTLTRYTFTVADAAGINPHDLISVGLNRKGVNGTSRVRVWGVAIYPLTHF